MLRRGAALGVALGLVACTAPPPADVQIGLRNPTATLAGTSRFDAARFAGDWQTVGCIGTCAASVRYLPATGGFYVRRVGEAETPYLISAPGILRQRDGTAVLVVMWVDEGFRTAAVGDADGTWAAILNRSRTPARDHVTAATEILDFNGWYVSQLRNVK